ncbi:MAG TPA: HAD-IA family hydrolase [Polyangiaceae bacterium]|nr:HAD-IA family hydrolase [Polyangiaceae bacterium]
MHPRHLAPPGAVIFDLDGTLIDSRTDIAATCNHALITHGRAPLPADRIRTFVGDGARLLLSRAFALAPDSPDLEAPLAAFHAFYLAHPVVHTTLLPGAPEALDACRDAGAKRILVTNKPHETTLRVLDVLGLQSTFDAIRGGGNGPLKPNPFALLAALEQVGVAPARAWMVGDGPQDIGAGKAARCAATIGVLEGFVDPARLHAAGPDVVLRSLHEFPALLDGQAIKVDSVDSSTTAPA